MLLQVNSRQINSSPPLYNDPTKTFLISNRPNSCISHPIFETTMIQPRIIP
ncbi:uncharacterized protein M6B38_148290 [Iris pallida]|uniref:Uncharacterized protein n=1 Tax=Iris pallida TaxID=29817 RepID=A0AAX6F8Q7_IRIPA|nr:uncharacterized protein M6B38_148290 [Iris pallida]